MTTNLNLRELEQMHPDPIVQRLVAVVRQAIDTLSVLMLSGHPRMPDPLFGDDIRRLGERIGYGALMSGAEAEWRESNRRRGMPDGAEHTSGPCRSTVDKAIDELRTALDGITDSPTEES